MKKLSKKDQTPETEAQEAEARERMAKKKCTHFEMGTYVVQYGKGRGLITGITKDGGSKLWVEWEDGTAGPIRNPMWKWKGRNA